MPDLQAGLRALFERKFGQPPQSVVQLDAKTGGSDRKLFRLFGAGGSAIGAANADTKENAAFLGMSRHFRSNGLLVPDIYAADEAAGLYLEEDLGDTTLFEFLSAHRPEGGPDREVVALYREVVRQLPRFQIVAGKTVDYSLCHPRAAFDRQSMLWDLNYFKYYFL
ncbi:MAG: phosphotransferase enzyme family protein, partial [Elusimicrobia bacterium]|nr:phosphotransferase enzyme family protein [Elusimicrobiota bacterium]